MSGATRQTVASMPISYRGKDYDSLQQCCDELGVNLTSLRTYKSKQKCTFEEAINHYVDKDKFIFRGQEYKTISECCKQLGIVFEYANVYRKRNNCTWEEALNYYVEKHGSV